MARIFDRARSSSRIGLIGLVLLILLVLLVTHALVMSAGHGEAEACGSCVVVIGSGLAAIAAMARPQAVSGRALFGVGWIDRAPSLVRPPIRPRGRYTVLRL